MKELSYTDYKTKKNIIYAKVNDNCGFYRFNRGTRDFPEEHLCYRFDPCLDLVEEKDCQNCPYFLKRLKKNLDNL